MAEREPLPPGVLPNITDTDPPPLHPATVVGDGVVYVDEAKLQAPPPPSARHGAMPTPHPQQHDQHGGTEGRQEGTERRR